MKKKEERTNRILEIISSNEATEVSRLSEILNVSQVTVRKDLDAMEEMGIIKREHGYARLSNSNFIQGRLAYHYEEKCKIAKKAAELVNDGETIMIESGSCCALLASKLAESKQNLTIMRNSAFIANYIRNKADFQIILLGGIYQSDAQVMVGPMVKECAENFFVDKIFIGIDGYTDKSGFTNKDQLRAKAAADMALQAERIIILSESEKFGVCKTVPIKIKDKKISLITDSKISKADIESLRKRNTELITV